MKIYKYKNNEVYINCKITVSTILKYKKNFNIKKKNRNKLVNNIYNYVININIFINKKIKKTIKENMIIIKRQIMLGIKNKNIFNKKILISKSKGKGFCGTIKRHKFKSNRKTHGNSKAHNKPGSIGMCQTPGRILKGKKMAGRKGNKIFKIKKYKILYINKSKIIIKGQVPGNKKTKIKIINEK